MNKKFSLFFGKHEHSTSVTLLTGAFLLAFVLFALPVTTARAATNFLYTFNTPGTLPEAGSMGESWSPYFWLNSGAYLILQDGLGKTVQGKLPTTDPWRVLYGRNNSLDTGNGYYPQNLFRLVTKSKWTNVSQEMQFKIQHTNLTDTPNRDGYSGLLFFSRYKDGDNLYYAGIRQDGMAVIKKKMGGTYYTMDLQKVWSGTYHKWNNPSLIPKKQWMRLRLVTQDQADGSVVLTLYVDKTNTGNYVQVARGVDVRGKYGSSVLSGSGSAGIRSDYQDVFFNGYRLTEL